MLSFRQNAPTTRASQGLVCCKRHDISERNRVWVGATCNEPSEVSNVKQQQRTDLIGDLFERLRVEPAGVTRRTRHDEFWSVLYCKLTNAVHVDTFLSTNTKRHKVVEQPACVYRGTMCEMATVVKTEPEHGVTG